MNADRRHGRWQVLTVIGLAFFFLTASTFTSLSVVLYRMSAELHWSQTEAGLSFSLLGLACGLASPLPAIGIRHIGARWTTVSGALMVGLGFLIASVSYGIGTFYGAICLIGCGFSLMAPLPGMYLLPRWYGTHAPRFIGFYFMAGSFGGVVGPVLVNASVAWTASWRLHWTLMAGTAAGLALLCAAFVRDPSVAAQTAAQAEAGGKAPAVWSVRDAIRTRAFIATAFAMLVVQTALTVSNYALVGHMLHLGARPGLAAIDMALLALSGTIAKGIAGPVAERIDPLILLLGSLAIDGLAFVALGTTRSIPLTMVATAVFGAGWGVAWLSAHLFLLRRFGEAVTPELVALATTLTSFAVIGPASAGAVFDRTGSFSSVFLISGALLLVALFSTLTIRRTGNSAPAPSRSFSAG